MEDKMITDALYLKRHHLRMSQSALAAKSGVNRNTIRAMELGQISRMQLSTIQAVANVLGFTVVLTLDHAATVLAD